MRRKPIFEYRLNGELCSEDGVINYACKFEIPEEEFDPNVEFDIQEAIQIIRANGETIEYLG